MDMLPAKHIALAGILCAGKTSVGRRISELSGREHLDSDWHLVDRLGLPPRRIIDRLSRHQFQLAENKILDELVQRKPAVISLGSGTIGHESAELRADNIEKLRAHAILFNLEARPEELDNRYRIDQGKLDLRRHVANMRRSIQTRIELRSPIHRMFCDFTIDTSGRTVDQVAKTILALAASAEA